MTQAKDLISKYFYQKFMSENQTAQPIQVLGELYLRENQSEVPELSEIRFAQGEIYYHYKDFEAAIFKWESVNNELKPWAFKNIGDAHYELGLLAIAEDFYHAVQTESVVLNIEVLIQLFSLYVRLGQIEKAVSSINKAIRLDPDYPEVTTIGRVFFEDYLDWENAVELAICEGIRTTSPVWFEALERYVKEGHIGKFQPDYFVELLETLYYVDQRRFASLSEALWKNYKGTSHYFAWLESFNALMSRLEIASSSTWRHLLEYYQNTYFNLISGKFLLKSISYLIPMHLTNWLHFSEKMDAFSVVAASAVLAWHDYFPEQIEETVIRKAEQIVRDQTISRDAFNQGVQLYQSILDWADGEGLPLSQRFDWLIRELLDLDQIHLMIAGSSTSGKTDFVNRVLDKDFIQESTAAIHVFKGAEEQGYLFISDEEVKEIANLEELEALSKEPSFLIAKLPIPFLQDHKLSLIDTPCLMDQRKLRSHVFQYLPMADRLLFVLNADSHLTGRDLDMAIRMNEQAPELPLHFLLWRADRSDSIQEMSERADSMISEIKTYFPNAKVLQLSAYDEINDQLTQLGHFVNKMMEGSTRKEERLTKILIYIKKVVHGLLEKRIEVEQSIVTSIEWNQEMVTKLNGAYHQIQDIEETTSREFKNSYNEIKTQFKQNLMEKIPSLLKDCSNLVKENSEFSTLHVSLNEEMNKHISTYIEETAIPNFEGMTNEWLTGCEEALSELQTTLDDLGDGFNQLYGDEKIHLKGDFKILEDWRRDMARMTRGILPLKKANILFSSAPSQFLMKGAGKLLGALSKNTELIHTKYKQFIEHQDYTPVADSIAEECLKGFELFERSLERDLTLFFAPLLEHLQTIQTESEEAIHTNKETLNEMKTNPEQYRDPLTLFEIKQRQISWMVAAEKEDQVLY